MISRYCAALLLGGVGLAFPLAAATPHPNILVIYADDLGYGDVGCYGARALHTPRIDRLAREGARFTEAHATSATCTPSRYALLTGRYPWRRSGTDILDGDARLIIDAPKATLPARLQAAGYATAAIGKWHLGLGDGHLDWNGSISPGPCDVGFDHCFIIPATLDRVPCVFVADRAVVGLQHDDPLSVSYGRPIGNDPTGRDHPELLRYPPSHGHNGTIVDGVSRIGFMAGAHAARWVDEDIADTLMREAVHFLEANRSKPFFLYFAAHDIHVPRLPHPRFVGQSGLGLRGDAVLELDWSVGALLDALDRFGLSENTLVVFSSDNGPVVDDGYHDGSVERLGTHTPAGPLRGGKYSAFEGGTRVPMIVRWPGHVTPGVNEALFSHVDLLASLLELTGLAPAEDVDSRPAVPALLGADKKGRDYVVEQSLNSTLSISSRDWKYIEPHAGPPRVVGSGVETGNSREAQLYDLRADVGETRNVAADHPDLVREYADRLDAEAHRGRFQGHDPKRR